MTRTRTAVLLMVLAGLAAAIPSLAAPDPAAPPQEDPNKVYTINIAGSPVRGPKGAPVTLVELSDYQ